MLPGRKSPVAASRSYSCARCRSRSGSRGSVNGPPSGRLLTSRVRQHAAPSRITYIRVAHPHRTGAPRFVGAGWHGAAMRYSVDVPNFGEFAAPEVFAEVARRAEEAGWDALLVGDSVTGE